MVAIIHERLLARSLRCVAINLLQNNIERTYTWLVYLYAYMYVATYVVSNGSYTVIFM